MNKLVLALGLLCSSAIVANAQNYSGGSGTKADPYQIATKADLKYLSENVDETKKHFLQTADITFNTTDFAMGGDFYNNGEGFIPLATGTFGFEGSYNGGGHIIDSLYINRPANSAAFILRTYSSDTFGFLGLTNVNITGNIFAAGFVGQIYWGTVMDTYTTGVIVGDDRVGGITGANSSDMIRCYSTASVSGTKSIGGLAGENFGKIYNCYATGDVTGSDKVGGISGYGGYQSSIENSYCTGLVIGTTRVGGLLGDQNTSSIKSCYWDSQTSGWLGGSFGVPKTTVELQSQATFVGWDFANNWKMGNCITNNGYPILSYQTLNIPNATVNFSLDATIQNEFCGGAKGEISVNVTGTSKYTFSWSSGAYTSTANSLAVGTYTLVVTDTANCGTIDTTFDIVAEPFFDAQAKANASGVCQSGSSTITLDKSAYGAKYYLRQDANDSIIDGPVIGTGGAISFTSNVISTTTDYNILAATLNSGNSIDSAFLNALEFTGNNDLKQVTLSDSLWIDNFQGKNAFTIEAWINRSSTGNLHTILSNYSGSYPLLLRIDNDKVNLHMNSAVSATTTSTIPVGVWTHVAGTYDGTTIRVYVNGVMEAIVPHSSALQAANSALRIGGGIANNTEFFLGSIADVRLWDRAKTEAEINAQMNEVLSGMEAGLVANYQFNEGSGATAANSVQANAKYSGTLMNSPSWVTGPVLTQVLCTDEFASLVTANVGNVYPDSATTLNGLTITANEANATYQWIDCDNGNAPINGETNQSYTATANGNYAVIINNGTCQSISECVNIKGVGIEDIYQAMVKIFPNPSQGKVQIQLENSAQTIESAKVLNLLGKEVYQTSINQSQAELNLNTLPSGVYFVQVQIDGQSIVKRIILE